MPKRIKDYGWDFVKRDKLHDGMGTMFGTSGLSSFGRDVLRNFTKTESIPETAAKVDTEEQRMARLALAVGDINAAQILRIADRKDWSGEHGMEEILKTDPRFGGKDSEEWGALLGVLSAAVRSYQSWKRLQKSQRNLD